MAFNCLLTGKKRQGKTLCAIQIAAQYLKSGRIVATNLNLNLEHLLPPWCKTLVYRLPDCPTSEDLKMLPPGNSQPAKDQFNGLILLDELATFINSREWKDKDRLNLVSWLSQCGKDGWDTLYIAQHPKMVDSQIREALCEIAGYAKRSDNIAIPVLSSFTKYFFGYKLTLPKFHVVSFQYGFSNSSPSAGYEFFGGSDFYAAYDTTQKINPMASLPGSEQVYGSAICTMLSPWYLSGRYKSKGVMVAKYGFAFLLIGLAFGIPAGHFFWPHSVATVAPSPVSESFASSSVFVTSLIKRDKDFTAFLSDGRVLDGTDWKIDLTGEYYKLNGQWYEKAH